MAVTSPAPSSVMRPDGRVRLHVEVPVDIASLVDELVARSGLDRETVLGDLAAVGLPALLAELADEAVAHKALGRLITIELSPDTTMPPALTDGVVSTTLTGTTVEPHFTRLDHDSVDGPGADT